MEQLLEQLGGAFWQAIVPLLTAILIGYLTKLANQYREKIQDERLRALVDELVRAAEQEYGAHAGAVKYGYVVAGLNEHKVHTGRAAIEAAVYNVNSEKENY